MNKNFGKIENGVFCYAPRELLKEGGYRILSNDPKLYKSAGYLPVIRLSGEGEPEERDGVIYLYESEEKPISGGDSEEISGDEFLAAFEKALGV